MYGMLVVDVICLLSLKCLCVHYLTLPTACFASPGNVSLWQGSSDCICYVAMHSYATARVIYEFWCGDDGQKAATSLSTTTALLVQHVMVGSKLDCLYHVSR